MSDVYKKQIGGDHYQSMEIQPSEFINKNNLPFAEGNAIKYLCRHKQKGQRKDLEKAIHYCQMAIDRDYPEKVKTVSEKLQDELEPITDFLEEAEKEKKELEESYKESRRQTEERKEKERRTGPIDSFSDDLQNSIKESRRQTEERKSKEWKKNNV